MRFLTFAELRTHLDVTKIDLEQLTDGFRAANSSHNYLWTNSDTLLQDTDKYVADKGWNPDTTLILYAPPHTEEEREEMAKETARQIAEDPDWDDIQIGYVDPKQIVASLYQDMTVERLVEILVGISK